MFVNRESIKLLTRMTCKGSTFIHFEKSLAAGGQQDVRSRRWGKTRVGACTVRHGRPRKPNCKASIKLKDLRGHRGG
uniref:Uncharacterized protein n=1 Tax=Anguilla anguilla TaxID=7936 RepID=A0A0E9RLA7_ANGAN